MSYLDKVSVGGTTYDVQDSKARTALEETQSAGLDKLAGGKLHPFYPGHYSTGTVGSAVTFSESATMVSTRFAVTPGERIIINASGYSGSQRLYVFIDASGNALNQTTANQTGVRVVTAPEGAVELAVNNRLATQGSGYYCISGGWGRSYFDITEVEQGTYTDTTGTTAYSADYCRTPLYPIGDIAEFITPASVAGFVYQFNASKTFLARISKATARDYLRETLASNYGGTVNGETVAYLAFTIRLASPTTPEMVLASGFKVLGDRAETLSERITALETDQSTVIPDYYASYIATKINTINALEDDVSTASDSFIFLTDYHFTQNAQHSPQLIKKIVSETGITKLFFGGDAGVSAPAATMYQAARNDAQIYQMLWDTVPHFYGMVGNHEWNDSQDATHEAAQQSEVFNRAGIVNYYIAREDPIVGGMSEEGNYWVDNRRAKIRYFVLQATGQAKISDDTAKWLGDQLGAVDNGWHVAVFCHYAYTGGTTSTSSLTGRGNLSVLRISQLLGALKSAAAVTVNKYAADGTTTGTYSFDYSGKSVTPIAIFSGHTHWDASLSTTDSDYGILTIATTTDAYGYAKNASTGNADPRTSGTTDEQAFDVVNIDLTAGKVYMTRIGGGSDREFSF